MRRNNTERYGASETKELRGSGETPTTPAAAEVQEIVMSIRGGNAAKENKPSAIDPARASTIAIPLFPSTGDSGNDKKGSRCSNTIVGGRAASPSGRLWRLHVDAVHGSDQTAVGEGVQRMLERERLSYKAKMVLLGIINRRKLWMAAAGISAALGAAVAISGNSEELPQAQIKVSSSDLDADTSSSGSDSGGDESTTGLELILSLMDATDTSTGGESDSSTGGDMKMKEVDINQNCKVWEGNLWIGATGERVKSVRQFFIDRDELSDETINDPFDRKLAKLVIKLKMEYMRKYKGMNLSNWKKRPKKKLRKRTKGDWNKKIEEVVRLFDKKRVTCQD